MGRNGILKTKKNAERNEIKRELYKNYKQKNSNF
jgi:hypothetical protein